MTSFIIPMWHLRRTVPHRPIPAPSRTPREEAARQAARQNTDVLIPLRREEMDLFFPFTPKKTLEVDALPPSMYEAIAYFLLFNAIRDLRGDYTEHRSMMIHVSRFTDVQNRIAEAVNEWLVQVKSDVQN